MAGIAAHLAEPADTAFARGRKRHAKTDKTDCRHLRMLLAEGRVRSAGSRPGTSWSAGRCSSYITTCGPSTPPSGPGTGPPAAAAGPGRVGQLRRLRAGGVGSRHRSADPGRDGREHPAAQGRAAQARHTPPPGGACELNLGPGGIGLLGHGLGTKEHCVRRMIGCGLWLRLLLTVVVMIRCEWLSRDSKGLAGGPMALS